MPSLRSVNTILLNIRVSVTQTKYGDDLAPAHIMVSSPALPCLGDVVWVYVQNVIAIDHQCFGILIRERLVIFLGEFRGRCPIL